MRICQIFRFLSIFCFLLPVYAHTSQKNKVTASINVGVNPDSVVITPNSRYAYVPNNNNYGITNQDSVSVLDLKKKILIKTIHDKSFVEPFRAACSPNGKRVYIANSNGTTLSIIKTKTNKVIGTIDGFDGPSGIVITPDGKFGYVNNYGHPGGAGGGHGTTVSVVNLKTKEIIKEITVGLAPAALAMSPHGEFVYVINYVDGNPGTGELVVIRTKTNEVISTIAGFFGPFDVTVKPDGKVVYVTNFGSNDFNPIGTTLSVVKVHPKPRIVKTINLGIQPSGATTTPNGRFVYATNYNTLYANPQKFLNLTAGDGIVNIIDTHTNKVISPTIAVGRSPNQIKVAPNGKFALVTNFTSGTVDYIPLQD